MRSVALLGLAVLVALANLAGSIPQRVAAANPPNIVVILTDDQNRDTVPFMPVLQERLVSQGVTFPQAIVSDPMCCPSRATLLTGRYAHNTGVRHNEGANGGWRAFRTNGWEQANLFPWLDGAGYHTGLVGKYLNGYPMGRPNPPGVDFGFITETVGADSYSSGSWSATRDGRTATGRGYRTNALNDEAVRFVRNAPAEQPVFLWLAHKAPHSPFDPPGQDGRSFGGQRIERTPGWNEADVSDKPEWVRAKRLDKKAQKRADKEWRNSLAMLQSVDQGIEELLTALEETGRLDDTYVFFLTDNGYLYGQHRLHGKGVLYEEAVNFPLVVRGPGIAPGSVDARLASTTDLAPTIRDLAGLPADPDADGRSLFGPGERELVMMETWPERRVKKRPDQFGLRGADWVYIESGNGREFYDLATDRHQVENRWEMLPPDAQDRLADRLAQMKTCEAESCRALENGALAFDIPR